MTRLHFGGSANDLLIKTVKLGKQQVLALNKQAITLTFWDAQTGGNMYTGLLDGGGNLVNAIVATSHRMPNFSGPDLTTPPASMWADDGDPNTDRELVVAVDAYLLGGGGAGGVAQTYVDTQITGAKAYTDSGVNSAKSYSDTGVASAKSYADTQIAAKNWSVNGVLSKIIDFGTLGVNTYTIQAADLGYKLVFRNGTNPSVVVPPNVFSGEVSLPIRYLGPGSNVLTVTAGTDVRIDPPAGQGMKVPPGATVLLERIAEVDPWTAPTPLATLDPRSVTGLADGAALSSLTDPITGGTLSQATSGNQPSWKAAGINGQPSVHHDGATDFLTMSSALLGLARNKTALCVAAVTMVTATQAAARTLVSLSNGTAANASRFSAQHNGASNNLPQFTGRRADTDAAVTVTASAGNAAVANVVEAYLWGVDWSARSVGVYKANALIASSSTFQSTGGSTSDTASLSGAVGANPNGTSEYFNNDWGKIDFYAQSGSDATFRARIFSALFNRFQRGLGFGADVGVKPTGYLGHGNYWNLNGGTT